MFSRYRHLLTFDHVGSPLILTKTSSSRFVLTMAVAVTSFGLTLGGKFLIDLNDLLQVSDMSVREINGCVLLRQSDPPDAGTEQLTVFMPIDLSQLVERVRRYISQRIGHISNTGPSKAVRSAWLCGKLVRLREDIVVTLQACKTAFEYCVKLLDLSGHIGKGVIS